MFPKAPKSHLSTDIESQIDQMQLDKEAADCEAKLSEPGPDWPPIDEDTLPPTTRNGFHVADNLQPTANSQKGANRRTAANGLQLNGNYS